MLCHHATSYTQIHATSQSFTISKPMSVTVGKSKTELRQRWSKLNHTCHSIVQVLGMIKASIPAMSRLVFSKFQLAEVIPN